MNGTARGRGRKSVRAIIVFYWIRLGLYTTATRVRVNYVKTKTKIEK